MYFSFFRKFDAILKGRASETLQRRTTVVEFFCLLRRSTYAITEHQYTYGVN
jgi:hypothetical protein